VSRRRKRQDSEDQSEIDLTPMLDVVFIMLIFFIVTASFVKERSLGLNVPENPDNPPPPDPNSTSILIQVTSADEIFMDNQRVDVRSVRSRIAQKNAESPEAPVVVRAHEHSTAETYVAIADAAREANIYNVSLVPFKD